MRNHARSTSGRFGSRMPAVVAAAFAIALTGSAMPPAASAAPIAIYYGGEFEGNQVAGVLKYENAQTPSTSVHTIPGNSDIPGFTVTTYTYGLTELKVKQSPLGVVTLTDNFTIEPQPVSSRNPAPSSIFVDFGQSLVITANGASAASLPSITDAMLSGRAKVLGHDFDRFSTSFKDLFVADRVEVTPIAPGLLLQPTAMQATFTPGFGLTLEEAAQIGGFKHFNWVQTVIKAPVPPKLVDTTRIIMPPYPDPPFGGYEYQRLQGRFPNNEPYYLNEDELSVNVLNCAISPSATTLVFCDQPGYELFKDGEYKEFVTSLVGVYEDSTFEDPHFMPLHNFLWKSDFRGVFPYLGGTELLFNENSGPIRYDGLLAGGATVEDPDIAFEDLPEDVKRLLIAEGAFDRPARVPEPAGIGLLALAVFGLFVRRKRGR